MASESGPGDAAAVQTGRVIIITGPTAVGKTAAALQLAERLNGEIISADSVQIYRGLDVGSDKARTWLYPDQLQPIQSSCMSRISRSPHQMVCCVQIPVCERRGIPHHLLDIADVQEEFSAGHFFQAARAATRDILQAGSYAAPRLGVMRTRNSSGLMLAAEGQDTYHGRRHGLLPALVHLRQTPHPRVHT